MLNAEIIKNLEQQRRTALMRGDVDALRSLFDADLVWVHASGKQDTREALLGDLSGGIIAFSQIECFEESIGFSGDVAWVSGKQRASVRYKGKDHTLNNSYLNLWVSRLDGLRLAVWQATPIPN